MAKTRVREQWGTRAGFILAAVGSAVGLGNVWRFPFQVGEQGGASFLAVYLFFILLIGVPAMLVEFTIGRRSRRNPVNAFKELGYEKWSFVGVLCVITGFVILSYYSVVAGWTIHYTAASFTGAYFDDPAGYFSGVMTGWGALGLHALFMIIVVGIVALGVKKGIEVSVKLLVPAIVLLLCGLIVYGLTLDNAMEGIRYYLTPDFDVLRENWRDILPSAAGQAFFTLSLGMGAMITYASYLGKEDNLMSDSGWIVGLDTGIAFLVGLVIFPVLFSVGLDPSSPGAGALFIGFGEAISQAPGSNILGVLFFGTVVLAAVSSGISILEVVVSYIIDNFGVDRLPAAMAVGSAIFIAGIPVAFNGEFLSLYDGVVAELLLPLGMGLLVLFCGWFYKEAKDELAKGLGMSKDSWFPTFWSWHIRTVILAVVVFVIVLSGISAFENLQELLAER